MKLSIHVADERAKTGDYRQVESYDRAKITDAEMSPAALADVLRSIANDIAPPLSIEVAVNGAIDAQAIAQQIQHELVERLGGAS